MITNLVQQIDYLTKLIIYFLITKPNSLTKIVQMHLFLIVILESKSPILKWKIVGLKLKIVNLEWKNVNLKWRVIYHFDVNTYI